MDQSCCHIVIYAVYAPVLQLNYFCQSETPFPHPRKRFDPQYFCQTVQPTICWPSEVTIKWWTCNRKNERQTRSIHRISLLHTSGSVLTDFKNRYHIRFMWAASVAEPQADAEAGTEVLNQSSDSHDMMHCIEYMTGVPEDARIRTGLKSRILGISPKLFPFFFDYLEGRAKLPRIGGRRRWWW
jgi:hypothetical protein